ncbi:MAG: LppC family lipoprotein [Halomonadaceae bacterium]|nr:MAG: LppC family lipoprotein [Halomonadaceae bacterium]
MTDMTRQRFLLPLFAILLLAGCATPLDQERDTTPFTLEQLLQQARDTSDLAASQRLRLQAVEMLQQQQDYESARQLLQTMATERLKQAERDQFQLLAMNNIVATGDRRWAGTLSPSLDPNHPERLPENMQLLGIQLQEDTHLLAQQPLRAALVLIRNPQLADSEELSQRHDRIWRYLRGSHEDDLEQASRDFSDHTTQGWLELALVLMADPRAVMEAQSATVRRWQQNWPNHPAAMEPPRELQLIARLSQDRPRKIVLALPLSGPLASAGRAIREGFMAAVYEEFSQNGESGASVDIFDTHGTPFSEIYAELLTSNPDLVVGPLGRDDLAGLKNQDRLPVPLLALSYLEDDEPVPQGLYQFGLSGEDEARQVADRLARDGHRNAILIAPRGEWGERMKDSFNKRHEARGGTLLHSATYANQGDLRQLVSTAFGIDVSRQRANNLQRITGVGLQFEPRRRQDIDAIVLLAPPGQARQLNPLFAFYYGADLPVYGTSLLYGGNPDPSRDGDLGGIHFTDIPWVLQPEEELRPVLQQLFPALANRYDRLFALGADSFRLTGRLPLLEEVEDSWMNGHTGRLYMDERRAIYREQRWAQFRSGRPVLTEESREQSGGQTAPLPGVQQSN